ncbi:MAG: tetratricopeptide repeat protein [Bryobacterales bacterium]|nr:tetratricopeptide repeat protein [Bryobacterales bacterium]
MFRLAYLFCALALLLPAQQKKSAPAKPPAAPARPAPAEAAPTPAELGMKALEAKDYPAAIAAFERAVTDGGADYAAHFHLALAHSLAGHDAEAVPHYRKTLELKPGLYEAEINLGLLLFRIKDYAGAEPLLKAASEKKPGNATAAAAYGRSLLEQNKLAEAEPVLQKAAGLDPSQKDALLGLAQRYEDARQVDQAIALYKDFLDHPGVAERLGNLMLSTGRAGESIAFLEDAVKTSPTSANHYALAIAYLRNKDAAKAGEQFERCLSLEPRNAQLRMSYGGFLRDQRKIAPAAQQYYAAVQIDPALREGWSEFGAMLLLLEQYPQAAAAFEKVLALGDTRPAIHFFKAIALDHIKQFKPAKESYEKFLSLSEGKFPDEEFKARQRIKVIEKELSRR